MITAVDSSVLIDVLKPEPAFGPPSAEALRRCLAQGALVACDVVWAEVAARFSSSVDLVNGLDRLGVGFSATDRATSLEAGGSWSHYLSAGGSRTRLIADFLVGAHAARLADRLLTRDRGFYRTYFSALEIVDPGVS